MGFLKRISGGRKGAVPDWADFMEPDEYAEFRRLTDGWLRASLGVSCNIDDGGVELRSPDGQPHAIGFPNLAQKCHAAPRSEWANLIDGHLGSLLRSFGSLEDPKFDEVKSQIKVRIYPEDYAAADKRAMLISRPVAPGLQAAITIDYPETVATVPPERLGDWGRSADELFELGLSNVRAQDVPELSELENSPIRLLSGESFFVATWVLMLEERMQPVSPHGALVIVPNRHAVLFQPIVDVSIVNSVGPLLGIAETQCRQGPGSISPNLYWWKDGHLTMLPSELKGHNVQFSPPEEFVTMLNSLAGEG